MAFTLLNFPIVNQIDACENAIIPINPISEISPASYFPQSLEKIEDTTQTIVSNATQDLGQIISIPKERRNFRNTFYLLDSVETFVKSHWQSLRVISMTHPEKVIRDAAKTAKDKVAIFLIENFRNSKSLYYACKDAYITINEQSIPLSEQEKYYLESKMLHFKREGFHLDESAFAKVKELTLEIEQLEADFAKNLDEDLTFIDVTLAELEGVPERVIASLEQHSGLLRVTCQEPHYVPISKHCRIESTRKKLFQAYQNRAMNQNIPLLINLIEKRDLLAKLLDYESFVDYDLENQMAGTLQTVENFIAKIQITAETQAKIEMDLVLNESNVRDQMQPWNIEYFIENYLSQHYQIDEIKLQEYFPCNSTLEKMCQFLGRLFGIRLQEISNQGFWDPETKVISVHETEDEDRFVGYIVLDLFPREGKFGSGYCLDVLAPRLVQNNEKLPGIAVILANFTPQNLQNKTPALLTHNEVSILFHEFGHALHQLFGCAEIPSLSGYHTKIDLLEMPSQLLEELAWDPYVIGLLGEHYLNKEPIPESIIQDKVQSRHFGEGYRTLKSLFKAALSLEYYKGGDISSTDTIRETVHRRILPFIEFDPESHFEGTFIHLAEPLYRSKFYCYLWAKVIAKDLLTHLQKESELSQACAWKLYRQKILELGGGIDPNLMLESFLGRPPF